MAREGYIKGNYTRAAAPSEKGQMGHTHYLSRDAGQQAEKSSGKHLSKTHFESILSKNVSDGKGCVPWIAMNVRPFSLSLSLNPSRAVLQPRILHCKSFKKLAVVVVSLHPMFKVCPQHSPTVLSNTDITLSTS